MSKKYEIRSGRRTVSMQYSSTALQAAIDYVRSYGCLRDEITGLEGLPPRLGAAQPR
jgi:hypothetical protein